MEVKQRIPSRSSIAVAAALFVSVSLVIGAHAALNKLALDTAKTMVVDQYIDPAKRPLRVALVIGNGHYPDANAPLTRSINDARALSAALRQDGFDVDMLEDASKSDMVHAVSRLKSKIGPNTVAMLFFGGYGVEAGHKSYMLPVDAVIWKESDVRRNGISVESVLELMKEQGARAKLVVVDASRRNPYERRFRSYSHGLAPINAPDKSLILSSAAPGTVIEDEAQSEHSGEHEGEHSALVAELLRNLETPASAETVFNKTRAAISQASDGKQVPAVSSSLAGDVSFGVAKAGS